MRITVTIYWARARLKLKRINRHEIYGDDLSDAHFRARGILFPGHRELIPRQLLGDPEAGVPGEYNRVYNRDFEFEDYEGYGMTTINDTWYVAKIDMKE